MSTRLTILVKGLILIAVPLCFQLVFIALVARMRTDSIDAETITIHTKDVIAQAQTTRVRLLSAHGALQGLVLTGDRSFNDDLDRLLGEVVLEAAALKHEVRDRIDQTKAATLIEQEIAQFLKFLREAQGIVRDGKMTSSLAAERRRAARSILEALDRRFETFLAFEQDLDVKRHERLQSSWSTFDGLLKGGIAVSIFFTVLLSLIFTRNISGRIANLTENAQRLAQGVELTPPISGSDEIARLDLVFHEMAQTLNEARAKERRHAEDLESRAKELAGVNAQLREKAQENEMFVYSVSHDLWSPLVNLQGFSKELGFLSKDLEKLIDHESTPPETRRKARTILGTEMAESIHFIQTAVTRLSSIIDALLRLSRAGKIEYRRQVVEVGGIVQRVVGALRGTIDDRRAEVEVLDLLPAWSDATAVEQVFANVIGNAVNYLDPKRPGRIKVFVSGGDHSSQGVAPGSVVYAVQDNGLGIPSAYKEKVFAAFQRLHGDVAKGEGIGLALVKRVVERLDGAIWFESEPEGGTTFYVAFPAPIGEDEREKSSATAEESTPPGSSKLDRKE